MLDNMMALYELHQLSLSNCLHVHDWKNSKNSYLILQILPLLLILVI